MKSIILWIIMILLFLVPLYAQTPYSNTLYIESRSTDVFDEPPASLGILLPPEQIHMASWKHKFNEKSLLTTDLEFYNFDNASDQTNLFTEWNYDLMEDSSVLLGGGFWQNDNNDTGYMLSGGFTKSLNPNIDTSLRAQLIRTLSHTWANRIEAYLKPVLNSSTAGLLKSWYYNGQGGFWANSIEANLAHSLTENAAIQLTDLYYRDSESKWSKTFSIRIQRELANKKTYLKFGCRWHENSEDVSANSPFIGIEHDFKPDFTVGLNLRRYITSDDIKSNTVGVTAIRKF